MVTSGDSIDDIQRTVIIDRVDTTDTYHRCGTRCTVRTDLHTRCFTLQLLRCGRTGRGEQLLRINDSDRSGNILLLPRTVTYDHHLIQILSVLFQGNLHGCARHRSLLSYITNVGNYEDSIRLYLQRELTIEIGNRTVSGTFHDDIYTQ